MPEQLFFQVKYGESFRTENEVGIFFRDPLRLLKRVANEAAGEKTPDA